MKKFIIFIIAIVSMSAACFAITYVINNVKTYDFYVSLDGNDYIIIEGLEICDFSSDIAYGILLDSDENNDIYNNTTGMSEAVSVAGNAKYVDIVNNTVHDNTNIGVDFYGNAGYCPVPALDQPRFCTATGNTVYNSKCDYAECAGIYVDGARDIVVEDNEVYSNMYGIEIGSEELKPDFPVKNVIVRNNLIYDNPFGGWNGELCFLKCDGIEVKNNIVYTDSDEYPIIGGDLSGEYVRNVTFENNTYYSPSGADEIYFEFKGESTFGIDAFNALTGGNDVLIYLL